VRAGAVDDFAPGVLTPVMVGNAEMVVLHDGDAWYAFPDRCTHAKRPLSDGDYEDGVVTCIYHGATFDLRANGKPTMPALRPLACYTVEIEGGEVWVHVS
jgi:3-phenylpropionate/trans-cinnamate dioxygenase ferredoxin component